MNFEINTQDQAVIAPEDLQILEQKGLVSPQIRVSHILVSDTKLAQDIAKELEGSKDLPKDFAKLAQAHSSCPSKAQGGDLGYFSKGQMVPPFEEAAFPMAVGTFVSGVVTQFGTHLLFKQDERYLLSLTKAS